MSKENKKQVLSISITVIGILVSVFSLFFTLFYYNLLENNDYIIFFVLVTVIIIFETIIIIWTRVQNKSKEKNYDKSINQLNKLINYNKLREEIEQEIQILTKELTNSNVNQYIDINRLAFSGQNKNSINNSVDYANFLKQFGLQKDKLTIREGSAAFLSPFDKQGHDLFRSCQAILGKIDIFLRKTDNVVEKDDILMNIVSLIIQSEFILVNIDGRNPNVYYELGIAHAIGKPTILLSKAKYPLEDIGFDIRQKRIIIYENEKDLESELLSQINMLNRNKL